MPSDVDSAIAKRVDALPKGLREHVYRVERLASELARHHHTDEEKVRLAALAHDVARAMKGEDLLREARRLGVKVHPVEERLPILLHGPVGAELLRSVDGLEDQDIFEAVYWHTTAHRELGATAQVVFLADKLDPQKAQRYPFIGKVRNTAMASLDQAVLEFLDRELESMLRRGESVHPVLLEARDARLAKSP